MPIVIADVQEVIQKIVSDRSSDLDRLIRLQNQYYNMVNPDLFPTESKIPYPFLFALVEENIPKAVEYLFPEANALRLMPEESGIELDQIRNAEWALHQMTSRRLPVKRQSALAISDCFKVSVGYTIAEQSTVTPYTSVQTIVSDGVTDKATRNMVSGVEKKSVDYRHLNVGQVLGYKDGSDTNGPKRSSTVAFLDFYTTAQIDALATGMGDRRGADALTEAYSAYKTKAPKTVHESIASWVSKIATLKGPKYEDDNGEALPTLHPVVKIYSEKSEAWLAYGSDLIFEAEDLYSTMRCPITKWTSVLDGDEWYPYSLAEAMEKPSLARNIWINMMYDAMAWNLNRPMVYDKDAHPNGPPEYNPKEAIGVSGVTRVGDAVAWLDGPQIGNDSFAMGQQLDELSREISGGTDLSDKNYTRGGANAFQELVSSVGGRERMAGWILETGALEHVYMNILIEMQMMGEDLSFQTRDFDDDGNDSLNTRVVTVSDMNRAYSLTLSLSDKYSAGSLNSQERAGMYDRFKEDPYIDPVELRRFVINNEDYARRLMKAPNEAAKIEGQERNSQLLSRSLDANRRAGAAPAAPAPEEAL